MGVLTKKKRVKTGADEWYMRQAVALAQKAFNEGEVPIGAIVVDEEGVVIGRGYNCVEKFGSQQEHAEMRAMRQACRRRGDWRLQGTTVYVTLEPCLMCLYTMAISRCAMLVYGAQSPLFGGHIDSLNCPPLYTKHLKMVRGGVGAREAAALLKLFFEQKRGEARGGQQEDRDKEPSGATKKRTRK